MEKSNGRLVRVMDYNVKYGSVVELYIYKNNNIFKSDNKRN